MSNQQGDDPKNLDEALSVMLSPRGTAAPRPNHPDSLYFENALGFLYARRGEFAQAREVLAPLRERFEKVMGPEHIDVALWSENLALAEEGLGHLELAEKLLLLSHTIRKKNLGDGHGLTRRASAHLGRVCMARGKTDEAVTWLRALLTAGVARRGKGIALPTDRPTPTPSGVADINLLGDALSGKADLRTRVELLLELGSTLRWLLWRSDWLSAHIMGLSAQAVLQRGEALNNAAATLVANEIKQAVTIMETNPSTPSRFLKEARARLEWLIKVSADRPLPR
jgi:tetratricopeptide (TPR) repeat protein